MRLSLYIYKISFIKLLLKGSMKDDLYSKHSQDNFHELEEAHEKIK
jgi:hypothetical protein